MESQTPQESNSPTQTQPSIPEGYKEVIVTSYFNRRANRRIYARDCGRKAFRFLVEITPPKAS